MTFFSATSQVIITEIADPNNDANARFIELTNIGQDAFDLTGFNLIRWTNGNVDPTGSSEVDLASYGPVAPGEVLTFAKSSSTFENVYGFAATAQLNGGVADSNGDDQIALRNGTTIYDIFGVPGEDGTGTAHEFEDGRA
ncbi:MAG: lamin tail domain-containing protein, partial [Flavobacteriaceae bacterium]